VTIKTQSVIKNLITPGRDLPASFVVFLVAIPLSLGVAVASGAPVAAGLIAAVVGGIVAGALGGSPLQVSGPAVGLTVIVATLITPEMATAVGAAGKTRKVLGSFELSA
jgi:MFS superfamily sulfate permease-like transporter